ncbi:MAG: hypothetical protein U5K79_07460 [Cyclobacteriaceae bacterium]|nr:hypothetical protein [Cyclobacteriaceae bacterium]
MDLIFTGKVMVANSLLLPDAVNGKVTAKIRLRSFLPQQIMYGDPMNDSSPLS